MYYAFVENECVKVNNECWCESKDYSICWLLGATLQNQPVTEDAHKIGLIEPPPPKKKIYIYISIS